MDNSIPWASVTGVTRAITTDDKQGGFQCGPADRELFNQLFKALTGEFNSVVAAAGTTQTDATDNALLLAIEALIAAATGTADVSNYILFSQARVRLPIHFEVQTTDKTLGVITPSTGQIRIPASKTFLHRGIWPVTTSLTNIATAASKTYHLRWNPTDSFALKDLADSGYNPTSATEDSAVFDSTYDDMLVARVTTTSGNVVTVTNLANGVSLSKQNVWRDADFTDALDWTQMNASDLVLNWARTPVLASVSLSEWRSNTPGPNGNPTGNAEGSCRGIGVRINPSNPVTRYHIPNFQFYYEDSTRTSGKASVLQTALAA
jgi:hypothetical protein